MNAHSELSSLYDVIIAGGGPAGAATGIDLARSGFTALIADAGSKRRLPIGETLQADAFHELFRLGCVDSFLADGHRRLHGMCSLWGSDTPHYRDGFTSPVGSGWILDRVRFEATMLAEAEAAGVVLCRQMKVKSAYQRNEYWTVKLHSSAQDYSVRSRFLVDATGRAAILARGMGARCHYFDRLSAVYAVFPAVAESFGRMSTIESFGQGWWYSAGLPDGRTAVGLFSDSDLVRSRSLASPKNWLRLLRECSLARKLIPAGFTEPNLTVCSAVSQIVECAGARWIPVGDAASAWDPLASAGITMALRTGLEASCAIQAALGGDEDAIARYGRRIFRRMRYYLAERTDQYAAEDRWLEEPFWKRRRVGAVETFIQEIPQSIAPFSP